MAAKPYHPYMSRPRCSSAGGGFSCFLSNDMQF